MLEMAFWLTMLVLWFVGSVLSFRFFTFVVGLSRFPLWRVVIALLTIAGLGAALVVGGYLLCTQAGLPSYAAVGLFIFGWSLAAWMTLTIVLWVSPSAGLRALALVGLATIVAVSAEAVPIKLLHRAFKVSSNSMAPTLRGTHVSGVCPLCRGETVVSVRIGRHPEDREVDERGICTVCLQIAPDSQVGGREQRIDRIIISSLAKPQRWDLIVFRFPQDRKQIYVQRLVGLPGETIELHEGGIWINGQELMPPPEIAGIKWSLEPAALDSQRWAKEGEPLHLGDNECFALGDFSTNASDSRFWGTIPRDDILGTVALIYFPPQRWRVFPRH